MPKEPCTKKTFRKFLNFNVLLNNVNGLQLSKKRLQMFEYFKTKIDLKGILFLQETHSSMEIEKKWNDEFNGQLFFSHGKTNSCGVVIAFYGNINYSVQKQLIDSEGRILILEVEIENENYLLIN